MTDSEKERSSKSTRTEDNQEFKKDIKDQITINIIGSGVLGLTCALELLKGEEGIDGNDGEDRFQINIITDDEDSKTWSKLFSLDDDEGEFKDLSNLNRTFKDLRFKTNFASPWAGAFWLSFCDKPKSELESRMTGWESISFSEFWKISEIDSSPVMKIDCCLYYDHHLNDEELPWYMNLCPEARKLDEEELKSLPNGKVDGIRLKTISINPMRYLNYLHNELNRFENFRVIHRRMNSIYEAFDGIKNDSNNEDFSSSFGVREDETIVPSSEIVINATGLGSLDLVGVEDKLVEPIRGQTILIKPPKPLKFSTRDKSNSTYIISRPPTIIKNHSQRTKENLKGESEEEEEEVILGGCYQTGRFELEIDEKLSRFILEEALKIRPDLSEDGTIEGIEILKNIVALRPSRRTGPRLEIQSIDQNQLNKKDFNHQGQLIEKFIIHCYGIGGAGFQASYGMAKEVKKLIKEKLMVKILNEYNNFL